MRSKELMGDSRLTIITEQKTSKSNHRDNSHASINRILVLRQKEGSPIISFAALPSQMTFLEQENDFKATPPTEDSPRSQIKQVPSPLPLKDINFFAPPPEKVVTAITTPLATNQRKVAAPTTDKSCCIML